MRNALALAIAVAACSSPHPTTATSTDAPAGEDAPVSTPDAARDDDGDGLDDAYELKLAHDYMPFLSLDPNDGCSLDGMLVRVRPHPADATKILIVYDHLLEHDCGLDGHIGDDEVFGVAIDPQKPAPEGILAIRAVSHQGTLCERDTECATCSGDSRGACDMVGGYPVVYSSKDKHGNYATKGSCGLFTTCFDTCTLASQRTMPPIANAGEPAHHMISDLTTQAFITTANGWTEPSLMNFDPWNTTKDFGGAGNIASDLVDTAFEAAPCGP
jgi:hypothetical protein